MRSGTRSMRACTCCGALSRAPERLATGTELGEIADDVGDELLALHGHMWRIRELLARGDVGAVNEEIERFGGRDSGPVHPLEASFAFNVGAMMALVGGDFEQGGTDGTPGHGGGTGLQRVGAELLRGPHDVDLVAAWRAGVGGEQSPGGDRADAGRLSSDPAGCRPRPRPRRGGRDGRGTGRSARARADRLGEGGRRPDRGCLPGHGRRRVQCRRRRGARLRAPHLRGDAPLHGYQRRDPCAGRGVCRPGRPVSRPAGGRDG